MSAGMGWDGVGKLPCLTAMILVSHTGFCCSVHLCPYPLAPGAPTVVLHGDGWAWADTTALAYAHFASWTSFHWDECWLSEEG